jgi:hypothetical protein
MGELKVDSKTFLGLDNIKRRKIREGINNRPIMFPFIYIKKGTQP